MGTGGNLLIESLHTPQLVHHSRQAPLSIPKPPTFCNKLDVLLLVLLCFREEQDRLSKQS